MPKKESLYFSSRYKTKKVENCGHDEIPNRMANGMEKERERERRRMRRGPETRSIQPSGSTLTAVSFLSDQNTNVFAIGTR